MKEKLSFKKENYNLSYGQLTIVLLLTILVGGLIYFALAVALDPTTTSTVNHLSSGSDFQKIVIKMFWPLVGLAVITSAFLAIRFRIQQGSF